jgi:L-amino acid N-acyltransferase YncA
MSVVMNQVRIRPVQDGDAGPIAAIYNHYVLHTTISFEEQALSDADMAERFAGVGAEGLPWLVAEQGGGVAGYAYASKWKGRCAYRYSAEGTIYLRQGLQRRGIGSLLYGRLLQQLAERSIHVVIGGIALPNPGCVGLHEQLGFVQVAHFKEVGFKQGRWLDVGYWQKSL